MKMSKCHDDSKLQRKSAGHGHVEGVAALSSPSPSSPPPAPPTKAEDAAAPEEKRFKPEPHSVREEFRSPGSPLFASSDMKPPSTTTTTTQNGSARFLDRFPFLSGASASDVFVSARLLTSNDFKS